MIAATLPQAPAPAQHRRRRARVSAVAVDAVVLAACAAAATVLAIVVLFLRTEFGAYDVGTGDAAFAGALAGAAWPAGLAWVGAHLWRDGATPGQARAGLRVTGDSRRGDDQRRPRLRRTARLIVHPIALPTWGWLAVVLAAAGGWPLAVVAIIGGGAVGLGALGSALLLVARPAQAALHDRLCGTRIEPRAEPPADTPPSRDTEPRREATA